MRWAHDLLARFLNWQADYRTKVAWDDEHCRHDGSEPWCERCAMTFNPPG